MGKVFIITEGLENMGAMRTGGQGSVYKGRRVGEIITAVKLLPTPIYTESKKDKNFRDFQNEVEKLKKVNENPNPNVVKIMSSGITDSGSFPFIEMEFIEGPDLEELLKPPHDPIFSIREVIKVAEQLANALAHCHKVGVRHGDIKSNNVKFNAHTGNYVLLDFGLAIMSDEQRRSSLRNAGAIEFMAPEQNAGKMLCQTDVYSYGIIIYELLAGTVPFPLEDNGETARNNVMVSHMETPVPDVMELRRKHLPESWSEEKKKSEMDVPEWLLGIINKCLEKKPSDRFKDGVELQEALAYRSAQAEKDDEEIESIAELESENKRLNNLLLQYQRAAEKEKKRGSASSNGSNGSVVNVSRPIFFLMIFLMVSLAVFSSYSLLNKKSDYNSQNVSSGSDSLIADSNRLVNDTKDQANTQKWVKETDTVNHEMKDTANADIDINKTSIPKSDKETITDTFEFKAKPDQVPKIETPEPVSSSKKYTVAAPIAYFYSQPFEGSRKESYLSSYNNAELTAVDDRNGFIYVVFFNSSQEITRGWLRKKDLRPVD
jgi:eukaryotic-like serine/threonine-protein kinase